MVREILVTFVLSAVCSELIFIKSSLNKAELAALVGEAAAGS